MNDMNFKFDLVDKYTPDVVIKEKIDQIEIATKGYVKAYIKEYAGPVSSYHTRKLPLSEVIANPWQGEERDVDIQEDLGEQDKKDHRFEVYLNVKGLDYYKYRIMFFNYGTISYPVTIVLEEDFAVEYCGRRSTTFQFDSMKMLEEMLDKILQCKTMISLLQNLINEAIRQENKTSSTE